MREGSCYETNHPSIHPLSIPALSYSGSRGSAGAYPSSLQAKGRGTPWTGHKTNLWIPVKKKKKQWCPTFTLFCIKQDPKNTSSVFFTLKLCGCSRDLSLHSWFFIESAHKNCKTCWLVVAPCGTMNRKMCPALLLTAFLPPHQERLKLNLNPCFPLTNWWISHMQLFQQQLWNLPTAVVLCNSLNHRY